MTTPSSPPTSPLDHDADAEIDIANGANHASPHMVALFLIRFDQKVGYVASTSDTIPQHNIYAHTP
jgi:hypothetical protein